MQHQRRRSAHRRLALLTLAAALAACDGSAPPADPVAPQPLVTVDPRRSLIVTEETILARFSLERVLKQIVTGGGIKGMTPLKLFRQWWDTQNLAPGLRQGPHCNDTPDPARPGHGLANGYPYDCRANPGEGRLATVDPFSNFATNPDAFLPIALTNRFDLARTDGKTCGEYRIVYAKRSGLTDSANRLLIIFEAALPNPDPASGLEGCRPIAAFWASLSSTAEPLLRAAKLESFYFTGTGPFKPAIHVEHFGNNALNAGQIRTNQFMQPTTLAGRAWTLREFKIKQYCGSTCALRVIPATTKTNPFGPLFGGGHANAAKFAYWFPSQVATLATNDINGFGYAVPNAANTGQSHSSGPLPVENDYLAFFGAPAAGFGLRDAIQAKLTELESPLTPEHIVARAMALSCAGCHRLSNRPAGIPELGGGLSWPAPLGFAHISEQRDPTDPTRYQISPALVDVFLPKRKQILEDFLNGTFAPPPPYAVPPAQGGPFGPTAGAAGIASVSLDGVAAADPGVAAEPVEPVDPTTNDSITGVSSFDWTADEVQTLSGRHSH